MGYTQKLLKIQDTFFHFTHKKEISIYLSIFPSFTSSDSALANDGRVWHHRAVRRAHDARPLRPQAPHRCGAAAGGGV